MCPGFFVIVRGSGSAKSDSAQYVIMFPTQTRAHTHTHTQPLEYMHTYTQTQMVGCSPEIWKKDAKTLAICVAPRRKSGKCDWSGGR